MKPTLLHFLNFLALFFVTVVTNNLEHAVFLRRRYGIRASAILNSIEDGYHEEQKEPRILWSANIKPRKRPELFLELAKNLKDTGWEFLMIGHMQMGKNRYQKIIEDTESINPKFHYLGGKTPEEVTALLNYAAIFVSTCEPEGFPNNIIQACFSRCAIVSFDYDPDKIFSLHGVGAVPHSPEELGSVVRELAENKGAREKLGDRARAYAAQFHSVEKNIKSFHETLSPLKRTKLAHE